MQVIAKTCGLSAVALYMAAPAWAAEEAQASNLHRFIGGLLPILIIFGLLYFFLRRVRLRNEPYMDRAKVHMERIEQQNEEIIGLLKDIAGQKKPPRPPPPPPTEPTAPPPQG